MVTLNRIVDTLLIKDIGIHEREYYTDIKHNDDTFIVRCALDDDIEYVFATIQLTYIQSELSYVILYCRHYYGADEYMNVYRVAMHDSQSVYLESQLTGELVAVSNNVQAVKKPLVKKVAVKRV